MATKSTKKTATKKVVAKKTVSKPVAVKKTVAKKTPATKVVAAPVVEHTPCGCAGACHCHKHCHCGTAKKFVGVLVFFALGFVAALALMPQHPKHMKMPHPEFENGCLVVKCPRLAEIAPQMDVDGNNCISEEEFKAFKHDGTHGPRGHRPSRPAPAPEQVTE